LKVVHVSTSDNRGGAAIAANRLHKALLEENIDSKMLVMNKDSDQKNVFIARDNRIEKHFFSKTRKVLNRSFLYKYKNRKKIIFSSAKFGLDISGNEIIRKADVIHLHWVVGGYLSLNSLAKLFSLNKKIVWTLHDSWGFTGGCHVRYGCNKYTKNCGKCPILNSNSQNDLSKKVFKKKQEIFSKVKKLTIITPSNWLNECVNKSNLLKKFSNIVIPNTLDENTFKKIDKSISRRILNLDKNKIYICFGALNSTTTEYKGWKYLRETIYQLEKIDDKLKNDIELIIFGSSYSEEVENLPFNVNFLGSFSDEVSLSLIYNSADLFVAPSIEDNLPNTVLESLHCGTPVIAFDIGGMPDMIEHKKNGYLAKYKDSSDLANGILWSLENLKNVDIDKEQFNKNKIINEILKTYKS
jgi:glycosyltransferase involved in cell wall biosynthesis